MLVVRTRFFSATKTFRFSNANAHMSSAKHLSTSLTASWRGNLNCTNCVINHELEAIKDAHECLMGRYDEPEKFDAVSSVNRKLEVTTNVMQENLALMLENDSKIQQLDAKAERVRRSSQLIYHYIPTPGPFLKFYFHLNP
jgi:hypothetical protein